MEWEYYTGQHLETGDILYCDKGGMACVNSGYTTGGPSRIDSIPEAWSADLDCLDKWGVMRNYKGEVFDRLLKVLKLDKP